MYAHRRVSPRGTSTARGDEAAANLHQETLESLEEIVIVVVIVKWPQQLPALSTPIAGRKRLLCLRKWLIACLGGSSVLSHIRAHEPNPRNDCGLPQV
jgi:hypothetical protein